MNRWTKGRTIPFPRTVRKSFWVEWEKESARDVYSGYMWKPVYLFFLTLLKLNFRARESPHSVLEFIVILLGTFPILSGHLFRHNQAI